MASTITFHAPGKPLPIVAMLTISLLGSVLIGSIIEPNTVGCLPGEACSPESLPRVFLITWLLILFVPILLYYLYERITRPLPHA